MRYHLSLSANFSPFIISSPPCSFLFSVFSARPKSRDIILALRKPAAAPSNFCLYIISSMRDMTEKKSLEAVDFHFLHQEVSASQYIHNPCIVNGLILGTLHWTASFPYTSILISGLSKHHLKYSMAACSNNSGDANNASLPCLDRSFQNSFPLGAAISDPNIQNIWHLFQ